MQETLFDKILAGDLPADKVYEDDAILAFKDINPQAPLHILVIPKMRVTCFARLQDLTVPTVGEFLMGVARVATQLGLDESGYRVVFNHGKDGGQQVEYLHAHLLGGRSMRWPPG